MFYQRRLWIVAVLFSLAVATDGLKFVFFGEPNVINWHSLAHPVWVLTTLILLLIGTAINRRRIWQLLFLIYFAVFVAALLNQYFAFSGILSGGCMLFNLSFVMLYFLLSA